MSDRHRDCTLIYPEQRTHLNKSLLIAMSMALQSCRTLPSPPYVQTVGPNGYWNAHVERVDRAKGLVFIVQPNGDHLVAKFDPTRASPTIDTARGTTRTRADSP